MPEIIPKKEELAALTGERLYHVWSELCSSIDKIYDMDHIWNNGGKSWKYEYKYRRGGKTLCSLYAKDNCIGFMIILGKNEREKFEKERQNYSEKVQQIYDEAKTFHDGKWVMFLPDDISMLQDFLNLLKIKRKPNKKS